MDAVTFAAVCVSQKCAETAVRCQMNFHAFCLFSAAYLLYCSYTLLYTYILLIYLYILFSVIIQVLNTYVSESYKSCCKGISECN